MSNAPSSEEAEKKWRKNATGLVERGSGPS